MRQQGKGYAIERIGISRPVRNGKEDVVTQYSVSGSFFGRSADTRKIKTAERVQAKMKAWGYSLRGPRGEEGQLAYARIIKEGNNRYVNAFE